MEQEHKTIRLNPGITPEEIINFIDEEYPELKGLCYYSKKYKELISKDYSKVDFHFDVLHSVLAIDTRPRVLVEVKGRKYYALKSLVNGN